MFKKISLYVVIAVCFNTHVFSQTKASVNLNQLAGANNPIVSAVPFLTIAPDSRASAMGDAGVATSPDANSMHWNPSKYAFIDNEMGVSLSYVPWLRNLVGDMDLVYLTGYKRLDKQQVIAASLLYFALGDIEFTNDDGDLQGTGRPNEFAIDIAYARSFGDKFSGGLAFRYIRSDLSNNYGEARPGNSFAADISAFYNNDIKISGYDSKMAFGINISNIGNKISYTAGDRKDFIPMNLRLGGALTIEMDKYNAFTGTIDLNKLLVPTPPVYNATKDTIIAGKDPDVPVMVGLFRSFFDAPGGFKEEMNEISYSVGLEYLYRQQFAIRGGYFAEHQNKGNRKYFTAGLGIKFNVIGIDFSYLIPQKANNPLANTLRFTLTFDFNAFRKVNKRR